VLVALGGACRRSDVELPPVKRFPGVACQPPKPSPEPILRPAPPPGHSCGLPDPECEEARPLVIRVDERGRVTEAFVPSTRSPEIDSCVLREVRENGWTFEPARDCSGVPVPGEYTTDVRIICGRAAEQRLAPDGRRGVSGGRAARR
jgi:hypothetical protein